jgi:hypothetical protein
MENFEIHLTLLGILNVAVKLRWQSHFHIGAHWWSVGMSNDDFKDGIAIHNSSQRLHL